MTMSMSVDRWRTSIPTFMSMPIPMGIAIGIGGRMGTRVGVWVGIGLRVRVGAANRCWHCRCRHAATPDGF